MAPNTVKNNQYSENDDPIKLLFTKLDESIDDLENDYLMTIEEAWTEIDEI